MDRRREIAKFACGFEACHALAHGYFWSAGLSVTLLGITATETWHAVAVVLNAVAALLLGRYAWRRATL